MGADGGFVAVVETLALDVFGKLVSGIDACCVKPWGSPVGCGGVWARWWDSLRGEAEADNLGARPGDG